MSGNDSAGRQELKTGQTNMNPQEAAAEIREQSLSNWERGDCFERIAKTFFQQDPH